MVSHLNVQEFVHRFEVEVEHKTDVLALASAPKTHTPNICGNRVKPHGVDIYGFRPLFGTPFRFLSPFELYRCWIAGALTPPFSTVKDPLTEWTKLGSLEKSNPEI